MNFAVAGLLAGAGQGGSKIAGHMWDEIKEQADDVRQRSLMELQNQFNVENQRRQFEHEDTSAAASRLHQTLMKGSELSFQDEQRKAQNIYTSGETDDQNKFIKEENRLDREAKIKAVQITADGKNSKTKLTPAMLKMGQAETFKAILREYVNSGGEEFDPTKFMINNGDGTVGVNKEMIEAKLPPEIYEQYKRLKVFTERNQRLGYDPSAASQFAMQQYKDEVKKETARAEKQDMEKFAKNHGVTVEIVERVKGLDSSPETVKDIIAAKKTNSKQYNALLEAAAEYNKPLRDAILDAISTAGGSSDIWNTPSTSTIDSFSMKKNESHANNVKTSSTGVEPDAARVEPDAAGVEWGKQGFL